MRIELSLAEILEATSVADLEGREDAGPFTGIASLAEARPGDLSFLGNTKYRAQVLATEASLVLLPRDYEGSPADGRAFLRVDDPSHALARICGLLEAKLFPPPSPGVHETAVVGSGVEIAPTVCVGPFCHLGANARIGSGSSLAPQVHLGAGVSVGEGCRLFPGVKVLDRCVLGNRVVLHPGVVIGSDGYGFDQVDGRHEKIPHVGNVVIEDDVEIGANTTIDRARFAETRIGTGTKIDNLVQIGHNVVMGKHCLVVAQVGVSGSVTFEDDVVVGGQAGFAGHLRVGRGAKIAGQAGITKDVEPGAFLKGNPALPYALFQRISVLQRRLPELFKRFAQDETKS